MPLELVFQMPLMQMPLGMVTDDASYYAVLHVDPRSTDAEVRIAYHRLARQLHPDRRQDEEARRLMAQVGRHARHSHPAHDCAWPVLACASLCWPMFALGLCWPVLTRVLACAGLCLPYAGLCWPVLTLVLGLCWLYNNICWPASGVHDTVASPPSLRQRAHSAIIH